MDKAKLASPSGKPTEPITDRPSPTSEGADQVPALREPPKPKRSRTMLQHQQSYNASSDHGEIVYVTDLPERLVVEQQQKRHTFRRQKRRCVLSFAIPIVLVVLVLVLLKVWYWTAE